MRGFEGRCSASKRQGVSGKNCIAGAGDVHGLIAAVNRNLREAIARLEKGRTVSSTSDQERLQFHFGKRRAAGASKLAGVLTDGRVVLRFKLCLVWSSGSYAGLRVAMKPVTRVESDQQRTFALGEGLLH